MHWLAYLAWPVAFVHSLTAGNDLRIWWVALLEWGSAALVATAVVARVLQAIGHRAGTEKPDEAIAARPGARHRSRGEAQVMHPLDSIKRQAGSAGGRVAAGRLPRPCCPQPLPQARPPWPSTWPGTGRPHRIPAGTCGVRKR